MFENLLKNKVNEFISRLFTATIQIHIFHLQVQGKGSYATHIALNDVYQELPGFIDSIVESYQGKNMIVKGYKLGDVTDFITKEQVVSYLEDLHNYIDTHRQSIFIDSDILNIIDEVKSLLKSTLYKLKNLE